MKELNNYKKNGYILIKNFFEKNLLSQVQAEAKAVFINRMLYSGIIPKKELTEVEFETAMYNFFKNDTEAFINCGKTCQHLISLHKLSLDEKLIGKIKYLGVKEPVISTRPVMYFNSRHLAQSEVYYKTPPHQDWRSIQGSLNSIVAWVPLIDINKALGCLEVIPGSHQDGLQNSEKDDWFRSIPAIAENKFASLNVETGDVLFFSTFLIHRSGNNITESIRWSCHFRYNDLSEETFIARKYPNPYIYKPQQELITPDFPDKKLIHNIFKPDC
jgi:phytanoyl-CoA hydroxylase